MPFPVELKLIPSSEGCTLAAGIEYIGNIHDREIAAEIVKRWNRTRIMQWLYRNSMKSPCVYPYLILSNLKWTCYFENEDDDHDCGRGYEPTISDELMAKLIEAKGEQDVKTLQNLQKFLEEGVVEDIANCELELSHEFDVKLVMDRVRNLLESYKCAPRS